MSTLFWLCEFIVIYSIRRVLRYNESPGAMIMSHLGLVLRRRRKTEEAGEEEWRYESEVG